MQEKKTKQLGPPSFANFRLFLKILSREFLLLQYNPIFLDENYQRYRASFFNLVKNLTLINSKPAIHALKEQESAMRMSQAVGM